MEDQTNFFLMIYAKSYANNTYILWKTHNLITIFYTKLLTLKENNIKTVSFALAILNSIAVNKD